MGDARSEEEKVNRTNIEEAGQEDNEVKVAKNRIIYYFLLVFKKSLLS